MFSFLSISGHSEERRWKYWLLSNVVGVRDGLWAGCGWTLAGEREDPSSDIAEAVHAESGPVGLGGEYGLRRVRSLHSPGRRHPLYAGAGGLPRKRRYDFTQNNYESRFVKAWLWIHLGRQQHEGYVTWQWIVNLSLFKVMWPKEKKIRKLIILIGYTSEPVW